MTTRNFGTLTVGHTYYNRAGEMRMISKCHGNVIDYSFEDTEGRVYTSDGHFYFDGTKDIRDLVKDITISGGFNVTITGDRPPAVNPTVKVTESISDPDQQAVRNNIARRADEARITSFANAALTLMHRQQFPAYEAWIIADAMEAEWQKRFGK
jgi:hypothetical protein